MNKIKIVTVLTLFVVLFIQCATTTIEIPQRIRTVGEVNIRSGPGLEFKIVTTVPEGTSLILLETQNDWHKVKIPNGKSGWIFKGMSKTVDSAKIVIMNQAYVHRGPGDGYKTFAVLTKGKTFNMMSEQGNWYQVELPDGNNGWISKNDAQKVERRNITTTKEAIVYQEADRNSREVLRINKGTELIQLDQNGPWYLIRVTEGVEGWINEDAVKPVPEKNLLIPQKANIRRGPGLEYDIIETLSENTLLTELERKDSWIKVRTPSGQLGWVNNEVITPSGVTSTGEISGEFVTTNQQSNIRQGYDTKYELLARVNEGTILQIIGKKDDWLRVKFPPEGTIGWIRNDLVEYSKPILFTNQQCNIRFGYSTTYKVIRRVDPGTPLAKISSREDWFRIYLPDGEIGWIKNDLISSTSDLMVTNQSCNVRQGPGTENWQTIGNLAAGTVLKKLKKQDKWYRLLQPNGEIGWIREDLLVTFNDYKETIGEANIRTGAGTNSSLLTTVPHKTGVLVIGSQGDWLQIRLLSGEKGWIKSDLVSPCYLTGRSVGSYESTPSTTSKKVDLANVIITVKQTDVRTCARKDCPIMTTLQKGTEVVRVRQEGDWYEIILPDGEYGYVHRSDFYSNVINNEKDVWYANESVRLRKGPGTTFETITTLSPNSSVKKIREYNSWYYVQLTNGQEGWVQSTYLVNTPSEPVAAKQTVIESESEISVEFGSLRTNAQAEIRAEPNTNSRIIKTCSRNTQLTKIGRKNDWFQVQLDSKTFGWIPGNMVNDITIPTVITVSQAVLKRTPNPSSMTLEEIPVGVEFNPGEEISGLYSVKTGAGNVGWIDATTVAALKYPKIFSKANARVRQAPSVQASVLAELDEGVELKPIAKSNDWFFISLNDGRMGWINKEVVNKLQYPEVRITKTTNANKYPSITSEKVALLLEGDKFQAADKKGDWYRIYLRGGDLGWVYNTNLEENIIGNLLTIKETTIRDGPGEDYSVIKSLGSAKEIKSLEEQDSWCKILTAEGIIGWIRKENTKVLSNTPLLTIKQTYVRKGPDMKYAVITTFPTNEEIIPIEQQGEWYLIKIDQTQKGWIHKDDCVKKTRMRYVFTIDQSKIRSGPGMNHGVIKQVDPATDLMVIGEDGEWYNVKVMNDGLIGWIKKDLVFE